MGDRVDVAPSAEAGPRFPEIPPETFRRSVVLVSRDGEVFEGAEAVFRSLAETPGHRWPLAAYRRVPGFAAATNAAYRFIARHRTAGLRVTNALWGKTVETPTYRIANA